MASCFTKGGFLENMSNEFEYREKEKENSYEMGTFLAC